MNKQHPNDLDTRFYSKTEAVKFLQLLDPKSDEFTFQTFDDDQDRKSRKLVKILHGTIDLHWDQLCHLSREGAGIFVTVNQTDGVGRTLENIKAVRAVWRDNDDGNVTPLPLKPHIVVESSPGKYHEYILTNGLSKEQHRQVMDVLVEQYGSDKNARDLARILRLPGFPHQKKSSKKELNGQAWLVKVIDEKTIPPYEVTEVCKSFGLDESNFGSDKTEMFLSNTSTDDFLENLLTQDQINDLRSALEFLDADDREVWVAVAHNLKSYGDVGFELWDTWAKSSDKYDEIDSIQTWKKCKGNRSSYKSIFSKAMENGWYNPKKVTVASSVSDLIYSKLIIWGITLLILNKVICWTMMWLSRLSI
jgi:DNA primase RepB-like protein/primase-like protein